MIRALAIVAVVGCSSSPSTPIDAAPTCPARDPTCGECTIDQTGLACPYAMTTGLVDTCTCVNLFGAPPTERAWLCSSCPWTDATNQSQPCTAMQDGLSCMWAGSAGATGCSCQCTAGTWMCTAESGDSICPQ
ncbi:MAG TPA: hypothetical protein VGF94_16265 [Kofleriaceae bacterium]